MDEYWSGFFTTDSPFKKRVRNYSSFVQASANYLSLNLLKKGEDKNNTFSKHVRNMQIVETVNFHHDAITGTHRDAVGEGYDKSMFDAL
jgi:hypothetical protein